MPSMVSFLPPHDMLASACLSCTGCLIYANVPPTEKGRCSSLLQDLYARSERASASCPITEAAMIRSEVTLVNHSTTARKGHLRITIDHCEPSTRDSGGSKPHEHPWGIRKHGTKGADDKIAGQKQRTFRAAEHIRADQGQKSNHPREQQSRVDARARHSAPGKRGLSWIEPVSVPQGRTRLDLRDHLMRSPQLWWPLNMGEQVCLAISVLFAT